MNEVDELLLEHFGKKGMKWGVRQRGRINRNIQVGKGRGSKLDKARAGITSNPADLLRTRSFQKSAARKGSRMEARQNRVAEGKTKARDLLPLIGSTRYTDVLPSVRNKKLTRDQSNNVARLTKGKEAALVVLGVAGSYAVGRVVGRVSNAALRTAASRVG